MRSVKNKAKNKFLFGISLPISAYGIIIPHNHLAIGRNPVKKPKSKLWHFSQKVPKALDPGDTSRACDTVFDGPFAVFDDERFTNEFRGSNIQINPIAKSSRREITTGGRRHGT
ncbi:hypothetical protein JW899_00725 [Candidatus Uhrbacteria bacterium]|nr:hypothetical protein [Candidatus Uhrbacteria bacterium]